MKIQYMSDLHMEFAENSRYIKHNEFPVTGDVLVLAGDTFYLNNTVAPLSKFWKWASANYRQVLIVLGNHEYYQFCDVMERGLQWKWMIKDNVGIYQNQVVRIDNTDFVLSTLWSNIPAQDEYFVWKGLNDFRQTKYKGKLIQVNEYNQLHQFCLDFVRKSVVESTAEKIVVVTHHLPTRQVVAPQHLDSLINSAFATELGDFIANSRINVWIYGHSHTNIDATIGKTRIVSNQLGYVFNDEHLLNGFDAGKYVELYKVKNMKQKDNKPILLIIPDIHGRLFWISATRKYPDLPVIFLGDYLDPYTHYEEILPSEALANFKEILDFKKANTERVTLLLGNHDIHYFDKDMNSSRKDKERYEEIHQVFIENLSLFKLAMTIKTAGKDFLFTHAGVDIDWLRYRMPEVNPNDVHDICKSLNDKLMTEENLYDFVFNGLMDVSASRWGYARYPSPVWTDETDHQYMRERLPNVYQVFGHTQQESEPVITEQYACLDCRRAFLLTSKGNIINA